MNHEELGKIWNFLHVSDGSYGLGKDDATSLLAEYDAVVAERDRLRAECQSLVKWRDELPMELNPSETPNSSSDDDEPITAEWKESPLCTATGREDVWLRIYDGCFEMMVKGDGWNVLRLPAVRTRGDVRQLVKLLGRE